MTKPTPDKPQSDGPWKKSDDAVEQMKQEAEGKADQTTTDLPREFTAKDIIDTYKLGLWYGKRLGKLHVLSNTVPHIRKQNERLAKAGHKVGLLKNALRAQVEAGALTAEAFDD